MYAWLDTIPISDFLVIPTIDMIARVREITIMANRLNTIAPGS